MKKLFFFLLAAGFLVTAQAQGIYQVSGKVINAETQQPLQGASVFAENTTIGVATDAQGNFSLQLPNGGYDLIVTFTGFSNASRRITTADAGDKNMVISLKQKEKEMADVVVKASYEVKDGWEKYGDFFLENFIGNTPNSKRCTIKNKEVLKFYFYKRSNRLKVLATEPVEIENAALGYNIKYALDSFTHEYNTEVSLSTGHPLFTEMVPEDDAQKKRWMTNRKEAYNGSILHFMRSLYNKRLKEEGFEVQFLIKNRETELSIPVKNFYRTMNYGMEEDSTVSIDIITSQENLAVLYQFEKPDDAYLKNNPGTSPRFQLSIMRFTPNESLNIERNGYYYEQDSFTVAGYLAWERVGDMLPYNYSGY